MEQREALLRMGYREMNPKKWGKPVGFQLLTFHEGTGEWCNWFKSRASKEILIWNTDIYKGEEVDGDLLAWLQSVEWSTDLKRDVVGYNKAEFHFITPEQSLELLL
jgi:hypothetical protein